MDIKNLAVKERNVEGGVEEGRERDARRVGTVISRVSSYRRILTDLRLGCNQHQTGRQDRYYNKKSGS